MHYGSFLVGTLLLAVLALAVETSVRSGIDPNRVGLYAVPLVCPAAPEIGCGLAAKPILEALEGQPGVEAAWLNRAGTVVAVLWAKDAPSERRRAAIQTAIQRVFRDMTVREVTDDEWERLLQDFQRRDMTVREVTGDERERLLQDFRGGSEWYRANEVHRLSEIEADIIAARLVRRVQRLLDRPIGSTEALQRTLAGVLRQATTGRLPLDGVKAELLQAASRLLDAEGRAALERAIDMGLRPRLEEDEGPNDSPARPKSCC